MQVSPAAVERVKEILSEEDKDGLGLRIAVEGGGCSGFQYTFSLDCPQNDDMITDLSEGVQLMIDSLSMMYLEGATLDFQNDLNGQAFVISNPNAQTSCGCGSSFSV